MDCEERKSPADRGKKHPQINKIFMFAGLFYLSLLFLQLFPSMIFQVFGFQAGLTWQDTTGEFLPLIPIIPSFSTALYGKLIQLPVYW